MCGFKIINEVYGYTVGDRVLNEIVNKLLKETDELISLYRLWGDNFILIEQDSKSFVLIEDFVKKLLDLCKVSITEDNVKISVDARIGVVCYPNHAKTVDDILRYSEIALQQAKEYGSYFVFNREIEKEVTRKNQIKLALQTANYDKEFYLVFQPQFSINKELIGMEALLRWQSPELGFVSPGEFIPVAEETGSIIKLGELVIEKSFKQIKEWNTQYNKNLKIGINISSKQINQKQFLQVLSEKIQEYGVNPDWFDVEITESSAVNTNLFTKFTSILNNIGVSISIDDFGTGYSSLSYIKKFDVDRLKIAKELVDTIEADTIIVEAIILMAKGLKVKTIAEGVETEDQLQILKHLGCDEIQGYIWGRPVKADEFERLYLQK